MKAPSKAQMETLGAELEEMTRETLGLGPPEPETLSDCGDGEVRPILTYPSPRLREDAGEVEFGEDLRKLVADLATTMYAANGIGISAPQIGVPARVFIVDIMNGQPAQPDRPSNQLLVAVNPRLWVVPGKMRRDAERCLSFPDAVELINRPLAIILKAHTHKGKPYALGCSSDLARAIQHENDHLEGKLLIDYMAKKKARSLSRRLVSLKKRRMR